jgi:hypothetical protein
MKLIFLMKPDLNMVHAPIYRARGVCFLCRVLRAGVQREQRHTFVFIPLFDIFYRRQQQHTRRYHYAISELCKGLYHHNGSGRSPHVLRFTGFGHRRERRRLEYAFLTNAAATVRSVGAVSVRACVRP